MGTENNGLDGQMMDITNTSGELPKKKRQGNPNWVKGGKSPNPKGRVQGSKNLATLAREELERFKHNPVKQLLENYAMIDDPKERAKIDLKLMEWFYDPPAKTTNVNVNEKSVQIVWQFGTQPDQAQIEQMEIDLGIKAIDHKPAPVMGQVIEETDDVMVEKE